MFLEFPDGRVLDFDLEFLRELLGVLDSHLDRLSTYAMRLDDPESFGIYESRDYIVGIGFAACQRYIATTSAECLLEKPKALALGPPHHSGESLASIINAAANCWKHQDEWALPGNRGFRRQTVDTLAALGLPDNVYTMDAILHKLVLGSTPHLMALLPHLEAWRDSLPDHSA
jgi:hypothetical protein